MTADSTLNEVDRITRDMLDVAKQEQWGQLAVLETKRRALIAGIDAQALQSMRYREILERIVGCNQSITQHLQARQEDIGLLLHAFGDSPLKADG